MDDILDIDPNWDISFVTQYLDFIGTE
jgi:hypothetical protein